MSTIVLDAVKVNSYVLPSLSKSENIMYEAYSTSQLLRNTLPNSFNDRGLINEITTQIYNLKKEINDVDTLIQKKIEKAKSIESKGESKIESISSKIGSLVGTIGGATIGAATGGVVGVVAGAVVGDKVGTKVIKGLVNTGAKIVSGFTSLCKNIWDGAKNLGSKIHDGCKKISKSISSFVQEKALPWLKNAASTVWSWTKTAGVWIRKTVATAVNLFVSLVEGIVSFLEAVVDAAVLIVGGLVGSIGGLIVDFGQGLIGKGWNLSATGAVWKKGLLPFIGENYTNKLIFQHYDGTFFDKHSFDWAKRDGGIAYEIGKGVGYYVGVIAASVFTAGAAGAAGGVGSGFVSTFANGLVAGTAELGKATQSNYNFVINQETKNYYINETLKAHPQLTLEEATQIVEYNLENKVYEDYSDVRKKYQDNISTGNIVKVVAASSGQAIVEGIAISFLRDKALGESIAKYGKVAKIANVAQNTSLGIGKFSIGGIGKAGTQFVKSYIKEVPTIIVDGDYNAKKATIDGTSAAITEVLNANIGLKNIKAAFKGNKNSNVPVANNNVPNQSHSSPFTGGVSKETAEEASQAIKKKLSTKLWEMSKAGAKEVKKKHMIKAVLPEKIVKDTYKNTTKEFIVSPIVSNIVG